MKKIALIGSTGSIGRQVLEVVRRNPERFKIAALVAGANEEKLKLQCEEFKPHFSALAKRDSALALECAALPEADIVFNAASGFAGVKYSFAAINAGKTLALANKETLVCAGELIMPLAEEKGVKILPVDSEHSAIWQCLNFDARKKVKRLILTASGGAFRGMDESVLDKVTPEQALNHPTWKMGKKVTIDSATLMNKGYEIIEAHYLYGTPYENIEGVIQPQSVVHSLVEFNDGACLAQMSYPTMELPIQLALSHPDRLSSCVESMDFTKAFSLAFEPLEREKYPCYDLAIRCGKAGGTYPCVLNAADEIAVRAFLDGKISFTDIFRIVDTVVHTLEASDAESYEQLERVDALARDAAEKLIDGT